MAEPPVLPPRFVRICVLSPSYEGSASPFAGLDPPCDPAPYVRHRADLEFETHPISTGRATAQVRELVRSGRYDLFFNLCDGAWDEDRPGIEVARLLESYGVPYTGADPSFYEPSREAMKLTALYEGVATPPFAFVTRLDELEGAVRGLEPPLIVKPANGYSSIGISRESVCRDADALRRRTRVVLERFGGALVEEFIPGREVTVLVVEDPDGPGGAEALVPIECRFPPGETFKHFDLKWKDYGRLEWVPIEDGPLGERLRRDAERVFRALGGVSYARCDFRVREGDGEPFFLEINPNCGVLYPEGEEGSADEVLRHDPLGHAGFVERVIAAALSRAGRSKWREPVAVRADGAGGAVLRAVRAVAPGERILVYEERPHRLVSRAHAERSWGPRDLEWLDRYGYPLGDRLLVMWDEDPAAWRPINHSCDPNAWLAQDCGLDVEARRAIEPGEEVTIDYATFCGPRMRPFECRCGAQECRGVVRGTDTPEPWVFERYGSRVSDYVWARRPAEWARAHRRAPRPRPTSPGARAPNAPSPDPSASRARSPGPAPGSPRARS